MAIKKITIQDIAETANVSKSTVSRVLNDTTPVNEEKKSAVLAAMEELNFKPNVFARSLAGGRSMTLGIVTQKIGSPFYSAVTQGVIQELASTDYSPILADGQWQPETQINAIDSLVERQVDGLIMIGGNLDIESINDAIQEKPLIVVARCLVGMEDRCLAVDNVAGAQLATQHLIELGHTKIVHLSGIQDHQDASDRRKGYQLAMETANLPVSDEMIVEGDFSMESGVAAINSLYDKDQNFTAVFAANDEMAIGARLALFQKDIRVPKDVSIIGFDDQPVAAYATPPMTTVIQPALEMGQAAAKACISLTLKKEFTLPVLPIELAIRQSTARLQ